MPRKCNPTPKVRQAGRVLSTSSSRSSRSSQRAKSAAAKKLANHRWANH